jgi:hypothetical protein
MTIEPDRLEQAPTEGPRQWVLAASALAVAAAIGIGVAVESGAGPSRSGPGIGSVPSTAPTSASSGSTAASPDIEPSRTPAPPLDDEFPVRLAAPGWTCDGAADEKFTCSDGDVVVLVTVRPANVHGDYLTDPDKASPDQYVSDVHGEVFATVNRVPGDPTTDVLALGAALRWTDP